MPAKPGWIDKCFGEKQAVTIGSRPVIAQAPNHRGKRKGSEVPETTWFAKNEKTGIVGNQVLAGELEFLLPADPLVTRAALEGSRLPADKAYPIATPLENLSLTTAGKTLEAEVMMLVHQRVPSCALIRTSKAHGHIAEMKSVRGARDYV